MKLMNNVVQVFNGELALDCLAQIDALDHSVQVDEDNSDYSAAGRHSPSRTFHQCYLHEVQASEALRLGCKLQPSEELPSHCLNAIAQLREKQSLGQWFAPFHESTPKFFGGDLGVCMAGHRDCVGIAQSCLQLRGYKVLLCDAGWSRSAVSDSSSVSFVAMFSKRCDSDIRFARLLQSSIARQLL